MSTVIQIQNVGKKYNISNSAGYLSLRDVLNEKARNFFKNKKNSKKEFWALKELSFDIHVGESIGIIGRNGSGKSTLLKIISRITPPSTGSIIAEGKIASLLEVGTGFHPELTGRENIYFNGSILGMKKKEIDKSLDEIIAFSGVEEFVDTPLKHYSNGMQLRLAFSVAAHLQADTLLIDEVLAVGDIEFQKKCLNKMQELTASHGRTVILVSHNLKAINDFCSRAIILKEGKIDFSGNAAKAVDRYVSSFQPNKKENLFQANQSADICISNAWTCDENKNKQFIFSNGMQIGLGIGISNKRWKNNYKVGLGLNSSLKGRVLIDFKECFFQDTNTSKNFLVWLPQELTPGIYTADISVMDQNNSVVDIINDAVSFEILLANSKFEGLGYDYGIISKKLSWENLE